MFRVRPFSVAASAAVIAAPALAQTGYGGPGGWSTELRLGAVHQFDTDIDGGGSFSVSRGVIGAGVSYSFAPRSRFGLSLSLGRSDYDFDGLPDLWGRIDETSFSAPVSFAVGDEVTALFIPTIRFAGEQGTDLEDGRTEGLIAGASWRVSDTLTLGPGLGAFSRLDGDTDYFPFLLIDWDVSERLTLSTGRGFGASRGPGLTLSYAARDDLSLGLSGRYEDAEFRLDDEGSAPDGIGRDRTVPVVGTVNWTPSPALRVGGFAGWQFAGELTLMDEDGREIRSRDYDPAPIVGGSVDFRF